MAENTMTRPTNTLQSWFGRDPLMSLRNEIDDMFRRVAAEGPTGLISGLTAPLLDLTESNGSFEVKVDLPGYKPDEIDIEVHRDMVRISGERKEEKKEDKEEKGKIYHRTERRHGSFSRSLTLPCAVKDDKVKAEFADGVLTVHLPKVEEAKCHKVKVQPKG